MASHRAERAPRRTLRSSGRRAARSTSRRGSVIGVVVALLAGLLLGGTQGSYAFWSDSDEVRAGTFTTGTLDLVVDGRPDGTAYTRVDLAMEKMLPGESVAVALTVRNGGDAAFTWFPTMSLAPITADRPGQLNAHLVTVTQLGGNVSDSSSSVLRRTTCSGGTDIDAARPASLSTGQEQSLCVQVTLPSGKGNEVQNLNGYTLTLTLAATQRLW